MPIECTYTENGEGARPVAAAALTGGEILATLREIYSKSRLPGLRYQIWDLTRVEQMDMTTEEVHEMAELDRRAAAVNPNMYVAVAASQSLPFGLARMWEAYVVEDPLHTHVCSTTDEAEAWIAQHLQQSTA